MEIIENANLAKLIGCKKGHGCFDSARSIAHETGIRLSNVTVKAYNPAELQGYKPKKQTYFFFVSKYGSLLKITKDKKVIRNCGGERGWENVLFECSKVYEVEMQNLWKIYINGRENAYKKTGIYWKDDSPKSALYKRLNKYKKNKTLNEYSFESIMEKVRRAYMEIGMNILSPSKEFMNKTSREHMCDSVFSFSQLLPQYVQPVVSAMEYDKREGKDYTKDEQFMAELFSLYKFVKNF